MVTRRFPVYGDTDLDALYAEAAVRELQPLWTQGQELMTSSPQPVAVPFVWRWHDLSGLAVRSGDLVGIDKGGDRRVLALSNPGLGGKPFATATMWAGIQYLKPGETAPAHRHSPAALRFVLAGEGVWTAVNGDAIAMAPGDLILTPSMAWHEHHNPGEKPMIWFDGLDLPLVQALDGVFFEEGRDEACPPAGDVSQSELEYGAGPGIVPAAVPPAPAHSPLLAYRWRHTSSALAGLLAAASSGHAAVRLIHPQSGRDVMPTLRCEMHMLAEGARTAAVRETGSSVWVCYEGSGWITLDGADHEIGYGDVIAVPSWTAWHLRSAGRMTLLRMSDAPALEALSLMRRVTAPRTSPSRHVPGALQANRDAASARQHAQP